MAILVEGLFGLRLDYWTHCWCDGETLWQIVVGLLPLLACYFVLQALPLAAFQRMDCLVRQLFWQHMGRWKLWQLAFVAALAGFGEELLFRGLLQQGLTGMMDWRLAVLLTSLFFGLAHAATVTYFLLAFAVSVYLGWFFLWTDNLVVPIAVHALYDFFVFMIILATPGNK